MCERLRRESKRHGAEAASRGYAKSHGGWVAHGQPERVFVRLLAVRVRGAARSGRPAPALASSAPADPPSAARLRSLHDFLRQRSLSQSLATVLTVAAVKLAGAQGRRSRTGIWRIVW